VASVRSCEKLPLCPVKSVPAGSKMDPTMVKAESISNSGSTSVITHLRRKKNPKLHNGVLQLERGQHSDYTKVSEEGGGGGAPGATAEIPLQPVEKTMVSQAVHLQPMEAHGGAGGCLKEAVTLWGAHAVPGSWQDL